MDLKVFQNDHHSSVSSQSHLLTISEYEEIAQRLEDSFKVLDLVKDCLESRENLDNMKSVIEQKGERITLRAKNLKKQKQIENLRQVSGTSSGKYAIHIFKVEIIDIEKKGYLMMRAQKDKAIQLLEQQSYILDRVKLILNKKGEIVLSSTSLTIIREEKEDTFTLESLELSQKEEKMIDTTEVKGQHIYEDYDYDQHQVSINNYMQAQQLQNLTVFSSIKSILQACTDNLRQESEEQEAKLLSFKELMTWKMPDHFCSNPSNKALSRQRMNVSNALDGMLFSSQINLYKLDFVTQRVKEQRVNFCGIVSHVKQYNEKSSQQKGMGFGGSDQINQITSQIDLESIDDKSRVCVFVKHSNRINLKDIILKNQVLLIKNALRKVSNNIDIYVQLQYSPKSLIVLGQVKEQINDFQAASQIQLIKTIPSDSIIRHIIKICGFISDINFIKIQYKCDICRAETQNESVCRNGCFIKEPFLAIQVLCILQDGTSKASLELKNDKVKKAFNISEQDSRRFKDYCLKFGTFMHPSSQVNYLYRDILNVFKKNESWSQMIFYCKPYYKSTYEKKTNNMGFGNNPGGNNNMNFGSGTGGNMNQASGYNETISKPSFLLKEKEKEIFLNGEVSTLKEVPGIGGQGKRIVKKTNVCLKCLQVDDDLRLQAVRNISNKQS